MNYAEVAMNDLRFTGDAEKMRLESEPHRRAGMSADIAGMPAHFYQRVFAGYKNYLFGHVLFEGSIVRFYSWAHSKPKSV